MEEQKTMLQFFNRISQGRTAWLLLALTALVLELSALYFQHFLQLLPCVMCIYERVALFGILAAGVIGMIAPRTPLRYLALILWIYSAVRGLQLSWQHTMIQLHPSPFNTCDFAVAFPEWLPLDKWVPAVFHASGDCSEIQWQLFNLSMPQWLVVIFAAYLLASLLVLLAQFVRPRKRDLFGR